MSRTSIGVRDPMCENKKNEEKRRRDCRRRSQPLPTQTPKYNKIYARLSNTQTTRIRKERVGKNSGEVLRSREKFVHNK
jgi:hypothetical protein